MNSQDAGKLGSIQWSGDICPRYRWHRICVQLFLMQRDITQAQLHQVGIGRFR